MQVELDHEDVVVSYLELILPTTVPEVIHSVDSDRRTAPAAAIHWLLQEARQERIMLRSLPVVNEVLERGKELNQMPLNHRSLLVQ